MILACRSLMIFFFFFNKVDYFFKNVQGFLQFRDIECQRDVHLRITGGLRETLADHTIDMLQNKG